jgi:hypothetical protein
VAVRASGSAGQAWFILTGSSWRLPASNCRHFLGNKGGRELSMLRVLAFVLLLTFARHESVLAQPNNVQQAINVIVTFCVAGGERFEISSIGTGAGGLELKKQGAGNGAGITLSSNSQAKGLVDGINNAMTTVSASQASEARKCMQPYIDRILDVYLAKSTSDSLSLPSTSTWDHNNSVVSVRVAGDRITISYEQPRQGMIDEGVRRGTTLFDGHRSGNRLSGTSYVFDRNCPPIPYPDDGVLSSEREIVLSGRRVPTQLANCQAAAYRVDPSIFSRKDGVR